MKVMIEAEIRKDRKLKDFYEVFAAGKRLGGWCRTVSHGWCGWVGDASSKPIGDGTSEPAARAWVLGQLNAKEVGK